MAEIRYLFIPEDVHFIRPGSTKPLMEEVLVDPDAEFVEGEKPEVKLVPVVRSYEFFVEQFICSHPIFEIRRGYGAYSSGLRILDVLSSAPKNDWAEFVADDTRKMMKAFSEPPRKEDSKALSAADLREMSPYEAKMYRPFIESIMNPRTTPPGVEPVVAKALSEPTDEPINGNEEE